MSAARKILIVDDDEDLRETLRDQLALHDEFQVTTVADAASGMEAVKNSHFDLIILDVGLPDMDGREACKALRKSGFKAPIIMLTGNASDADTILGLDAGANDYVTKPFKFAVLLARIRAQLRQHEQSEDAVFTIGKYTFKPAAKLLIDEKGSKIRLTEKETSILKYLYRAGEKVVTRDVLLLEVWGYNANVTTHTLETHIYRLRQKIERDPSKAELLVTETGGYKLNSLTIPTSFCGCRRKLTDVRPNWRYSPQLLHHRPTSRFTRTSKSPVLHVRYCGTCSRGSGRAQHSARCMGRAVMAIESIVDAVRQIALFQGLRPSQVSEIVRRAERVLFKPGDTIIREGETGDAAYLIVSGSAVRTAGPVNSQPEELEAGTLIGEMAMLVETEFSSTVTCRERVKALKITRSGLLEQMSLDPSLADHILEKLAERLRQLANQLRQIEKILGSSNEQERRPPPALRLLSFDPSAEHAHTG